MGGAFPDAFASVSRTQNAAPPRNGKSLLLASVQGSLESPFPAKSPLFQPCGDPGRQDVLTATDLEVESERGGPVL